MIDLAELRKAVGELEEDRVMDMLESFLASNPDGSSTEQVVEACQKGMEIVGDLYEQGEYFVGDLIFAGELLSGCIEKLKPLLTNSDGGNRGTIVLGTVEGDIHDIGKNIFKSMAEAAGFNVVDLGIDQPPAAFVDAVKDSNATIVGMSGVLTLSIDSMKNITQALTDAGLRDGVKVTIGGNAVSAEACKHVGADAWSKNAAETVKVCGEWVS